MKQSESLNQWQLDIPQTSYQFQPITPKKFLKIIDILKQQNMSTIKAKFSFSNDFERRKFIQLIRKQENDQQYWENDIKQEIQRRPNPRQLLKDRKGCIFAIRGIRSQIFLSAYRGNKLDQLQRKYNIKIFPYNQELYIVDDQGGANIKKGSIIYSEVADMAKRLKQIIFFNRPDLWQIVVHSTQFKKRLQKIGISSFVKRGRSKHVAFYSQNYQPQEIRKQVLKQNFLQSKVLKLGDSELSFQKNMKIFDVVVKAIRLTIDRLKKIYETNLQINKYYSCFILHLKHQVFGQQPISQISKVVSDLFIMSFPLRHSRSFINQLKRNSNLYPFINATHSNKTAFCCINRKKIQNKKDILKIFAPFLEELSQKSKLTIHMKPNCVLQQNSTMPQQILDLTEQCKVEVEEYEKILNKQKFNIGVKPRLFTPDKKMKKQLQFSNFLLKLLMLQQNQKQITEDQLNQSILNNSNVVQQNAQVQNTNKKTTRGNRGDRNKSEKTPINKNNQTNIKKQQTKQQVNNQNKKTSLKYKQKQQQVSQTQIINYQNSWYKEQQQQQKVKKFKIQNQYDDSYLQYKYERPTQLNNGQLFQKIKQDRQLLRIFQIKEGLTVKSWRLKINFELYKINEQLQGKLNKQKCYLVSTIGQNNNIPTKVTYKKFNKLKSQEIAYIVYQTEDFKYWVPTHMIQRA